MIDPGTVVVVVVAAVAILAAVALWRVAVRLKELEVRRGQPDQSVLLLQREIETVRTEARLAQAETIGSVRQELQQFSSHMTVQMGQVGTGVARELQHVNQVMGSVHVTGELKSGGKLSTTADLIEARKRSKKS